MQYRRNTDDTRDLGLDLNHKIAIFTIWWLRKDRGHAYFAEIAKLMQKVSDRWETGKILRRLQDQGYIDSRSTGYMLYDSGLEMAWEMAKESQNYRGLPDLRD